MNQLKLRIYRTEKFGEKKSSFFNHQTLIIILGISFQKRIQTKQNKTNEILNSKCVIHFCQQQQQQ